MIRKASRGFHRAKTPSKKSSLYCTFILVNWLNQILIIGLMEITLPCALYLRLFTQIWGN
jgi:hypothetical protein